MSSASIIPAVRAIYLCDDTIGISGGKTDLMGLFNSVRPLQYPYRARDFVVFAQFSGGLGQVPFRIDIRFAPNGQLVFLSNVHHLSFPNRSVTVQMVFRVSGCVFAQPGLYLVELFCDNQWVADTTLMLQ